LLVNRRFTVKENVIKYDARGGGAARRETRPTLRSSRVFFFFFKVKET
jgi:hypothetical protein